MSLSWVTVVWSMIAGGCAAVALIYLVSWLRQVRQTAYLAFAITAVSLAAVAICELMLMRAQTPAEFGTILRWAHIPVFTLVVSVVVFVRTYLNAGRWWLAWSVCGLRLLALMLNFHSELNLNYLVITGLQQVPLFGGESVAVAVGEENPWVRIGELSSLLLLLFLTDASFTCWRRGGRIERLRAATIGGSLVFWIVVAASSAALNHAGKIQSIYLISLPFLPFVTAIGYLLGADIIRADQLTGQLAQSEVERRIHSRRMDEAVEAAGIAIWEWDIDRDEMWIIERGRALFGFAPGERIDFNRFLAALHPDERDAARERMNLARGKGGVFESEYRIILPGGQERWVRTRGRTGSTRAGMPARVRGVSFDITERKLTDERFRRLVEAAPFGMIMLDSCGLITVASARVLSDFGYSHHELIGQSVEKLIPERFHARHSADVSNFLAAPSSRLMAGRQIHGRHQDGSEIPFEVFLDTISMPEGTATLATIVNVSEREKLIELLKEERKFLRQVIDITPNLIFAKDRQGRFTLVNQAVADVYGSTIEDLVGKCDAEFNHSATEVEHFRHMDLQVMDTLKEHFIAEEQITDASGKTRWLQTVKRPVLDKDGTATQVLGASTDITWRRQSEMELERQRNELSHLSRVMVLSELSGSLAHELNQPLTAILSNAQAAQRFLAEGSPDLAELREILEDIVIDDKRAGEIIQGLRLLLKKGEKRSDPLDINEVTKDVMRLMRSDLLNEGVVAILDLSPALPTVLGDRVQLQQVLLNLMMNGCEIMTSTGEADRKLTIRTALDDENAVRVTVTDSGPGIAPANLERVFEPFFTTKPQGLGLGLQVCRRIITAHGGRMWATNDPARGATFHVTLPVNPEGAA